MEDEPKQVAHQASTFQAGASTRSGRLLRLALPLAALLLSAFVFGMAALLLIFTLTSAIARRNILSLVLAGVILSDKARHVQFPCVPRSGGGDPGTNEYS